MYVGESSERKQVVLIEHEGSSNVKFSDQWVPSTVVMLAASCNIIEDQVSHFTVNVFCYMSGMFRLDNVA